MAGSGDIVAVTPNPINAQIRFEVPADYADGYCCRYAIQRVSNHAGVTGDDVPVVLKHLRQRHLHARCRSRLKHS